MIPDAAGRRLQLSEDVKNDMLLPPFNQIRLPRINIAVRHIQYCPFFPTH